MTATRALSLNKLDLSYGTLFTSVPSKAMLLGSPLFTPVVGVPHTVLPDETTRPLPAQVPSETAATHLARGRLPQKPMPSTLSRMGVQAFVFDIQVCASPVVRKVRLLDTSPERAWDRLRTFYPHATPLAMTVEAG